MMIILQCPLCRNPLLNSADGYRCSNNHAFDAAREGYVNLLPVQKKHSKEPGDNKDMIRSRRRFLDLGFYTPLSDAINEAVHACLSRSAHESDSNVLDAGCGEGFYLKRLKEHLTGKQGETIAVEYFGVDISKFAVRQATQRDRTMNWFVGSNLDLPFADRSFDAILNVFSPADFRQFARVLRPEGCLLIVTPGPKHLNGLREIIYPEAREHSRSTVSKEAEPFFSLLDEKRITYPLELTDGEAIMDLLAMTPYFWHIDLKTRSRVESLERLSLDVDVELRVLEKKESTLPNVS